MLSSHATHLSFRFCRCPLTGGLRLDPGVSGAEVAECCRDGERSKAPSGSCTGYREVLAAVERGHWDFVVEGEKDVDALPAIGLAATTKPGGAGKWRAWYGEPLRGARLEIVPGHDAGWRRTRQAGGRRAARRSREVRILELAGLPAKGDASFWIGLQRRTGWASTRTSVSFSPWSPTSHRRPPRLLAEAGPPFIAGVPVA